MATTRNRKFINRELSWLEFNDRVLQLARDEKTPLLERLKFLSISDSNLDEFFMVRVGGLRMLQLGKPEKKDPSGLTAREQLDVIAQRAHKMSTEQYECWHDILEPELAAQGIKRLRIPELDDSSKRYVEQVFSSDIQPILTPIAVDINSPLPLLMNRTLHLAARVKPIDSGAQDQRFVVVPIPAAIGRYVTVPADGGYRFLLVEELVSHNISRFFPGEKVLECVPFRITRNADMSVHEDMTSDLLVEMEAVLDARTRSECVRLEVDASATQVMQRFLQKTFTVDEDATYRVSGPMCLKDLMQLTGLSGYEYLTFESWQPTQSLTTHQDQTIFDVITQKDRLLYHPYDSFDPVVQFLETASNDPDVVAIKQVLYRTSSRSPIVASLKRAAEKGKYVTALVELKARFDEARNIEWAKELEDAGVQVIYGLRGLKTHAKICIVLRREPQGLHRYVHFGTGNYNESTARLYGDISYMTCDEDLGADASAFFNTVTGYSQPQVYKKIEAAPIGLRLKVLSHIEAEAERSRQGQKAVIWAKINSLADPKIIKALYAASKAGVSIRLNVRGICCLRPGVKGLSDNITVTSIVGRFLEHARAFYFHNGGDTRVFISSADWMPRNLDKRIELLVPIEDADCKKRVISLLETHLADNANAWQLNSKAKYERLQVSNRKRIDSQYELFCRAQKCTEEAKQHQRIVFEPVRPPGSGE